MTRFLGDQKVRRLKLVRIDPLVFQAWLKSGEIPHMILLSEKLPEDATMLCALHEQHTQTFLMVFESAEFPLATGSIPELETPVWGILQEAEQ